MQQVCGQSLFPRVIICAAFKHYTGWCLLSFMWLVSTHEKSMDLLLTFYISKCNTFLFVLRTALICLSCILFCDRSINSFLGWLSLCIVNFTITSGNWNLRECCLAFKVLKWCNQNLFQIQMYIKKAYSFFTSLFPHIFTIKKVTNIDSNYSKIIKKTSILVIHTV